MLALLAQYWRGQETSHGGGCSCGLDLGKQALSPWGGQAVSRSSWSLTGQSFDFSNMHTRGILVGLQASLPIGA